jgi:bifunctional oligoribonuclease and PAP phosphatase NrnA
MMEQVAAILRERNHFLVTGHLQPDGDALGSMLALGEILRAMGKKVVLYNPDPLPERYLFLTGTDQVVRVLPAGVRFDATLVVDCGDEKLLGPTWPGREVTGTVVVIDHHRSHKPFGDVVLRTDACAVGEMVFRLAEHLGVPISRAAAEAIYASMTTDTGGFRYASTTGDALRIAADMVDRGAQPWKVSWHVFEAWPLVRLQLLSDVLGTLDVRDQGRVALLKVSRELLQRHGAPSDMIEGFINYARMVEGVEVSALLYEADNGTVRTSLRSRGLVPVDGVAAQFGGGGHLAAAGCAFDDTPLDQAFEMVATALSAAVAATPPTANDEDFWSRH